MKKTYLFATGNVNKVKEIRLLLEDLPIEVVTMGEIGFSEEIPETGTTLHENAIIKARYLFDKTGRAVIAEDTGLEIEVLDGRPGVHTARYAGETRDPIANMRLLLHELKDQNNRKARFRTVIALIEKGEIKTFEGIVEGRIAISLSGHQGFGYDPIFLPENYDVTFAEMDQKLKSSMSHRGRALDKFVKFLST